ncbi:NMD3 family protein [Candida albicans]|uniref:60S ribosomal export protein NMD3 n=1 Tax=Candida albicans TaxID=5476 RepID=A0A8H6BYV4_CANAX|nr:NMD3 family protein [Candida albicans]
MDGSSGLVMCYDCIKLNVDITEGIPREANVSFCRNCERFLQPPGQWIRAELESRELLALCLRRLKGLNKVRLVDASFIWTEPHSRRIRIKITVQGEAMANTIVQQTFEVEYVVIAMQCPDCAKSYTTNTWRATVQIRQKVPHKRTFLYLEQLILKHNAHVDTVSIQETKDGLDFFYAQKNHAAKMVDFLQAVAPIKVKKSEELVSMDIHSGSSSYKFSYSVEIAPICRDDLVVLPKKLAHSMGNISRLVLCNKITNAIQFMDPNTLQTADLSAPVFWRSPFPSLLDATQMVEFIVLDIEPTGDIRGKYVLADIEVSRASDLGSNDQTFYVRTHLGVKKHYARKSKKSKNRKWKLKRMAREHNDIVANDDSRQARQEQERAERDYELFLQELEEDDELRQTINLYKAGENQPQVSRNHDDMNDEDEDDDEDAPEIGIDELLDELDDMTLDDTPMN